MKSFVYTMKELFNKGLRPIPQVHKNGKFCTYIKHAVPFDFGLDISINNPSIQVNKQYQAFRTISGEVFLLNNTELYKLDIDNTPQLLLSNITAGSNSWSCADFGALIIFANGSTYVVRTTTEGNFTVDSAYLPYIAGVIGTFKGRLIIGNITNYPISGSNKNWVAWSEIGSKRFLSDVESSIRNTAGYTLLKIGTISRMLQLGDKFIIYGTDGVVSLFTAQIGNTATLGNIQISDIGLINELAVVADDYNNQKVHFYVGLGGYLISIDSNLKVTNMRYEEFILN